MSDIPERQTFFLREGYFLVSEISNISNIFDSADIFDIFDIFDSADIFDISDSSDISDISSYHYYYYYYYYYAYDMTPGMSLLWDVVTPGCHYSGMSLLPGRHDSQGAISLSLSHYLNIVT